MKLLSLFSGIGAFEKALDRLEIPYELVGYCEIDKYASKSYSAIHGVDESMNLGDITKVDEKALSKDIDLITYGFPCQDISLAGKQKGLFNEDGTQTRSGLFFEALRIIEETQPRVAIAENVKNLTGKKFEGQFKIVLDSLEQAGYNNYWQVLNAKDFGIPQNRERVFIVSIRKDIDTGMFRFPEGFPLELRLKDLLEDEVDEKYYISNSKEVIGLLNFNDRTTGILSNQATVFENETEVANTLLARDYKGFGNQGMNCVVEPVRLGNIYGEHCGTGFAGNVWDKDAISPTLMTMQGGNRQPMITVGDESVKVREATKQGYAEAYEGDSINLEQPNSTTRRGRVGHGVAQTLTTSPQQGVVISEPTIQRVDIPQIVKVRKYPVDTDTLCETLRHHKALVDQNNNGISNALGVPVTKVEHWFRRDDCFAIPDPDVWFKLKELLEIKTDEFDESIMTFEEKEGVYEKSERHYLADGLAPTLTSTTASEKIIEPSLRIRKLTPKECFRLMDFDDEDFEKAEAVNSNTQLYKQAGNSIVVAVPYYIIKALIEANIFIEKENKEMELRVNEVSLPEAITFNYEELKQELTEKVSMYETLVYTDEQIKEAKTDKANLNKLKKALNDERIRREREYMEPFNDFKSKINEIIGIIDKPVAVIDKQVKEYEEKQKQEKLAKIQEYYNSIEKPELEWLGLPAIYSEKWLNASTSMKSIQEEINARLEQIKNDLATLSNLPEFGFEATEVYKTTLDLNRALNEGKRLAEIAKAKAAHEAEMQARAEEQARLAAEAEVAKAEQREPFPADAMNPPVEEEPPKQWVKFKAHLTVVEARELKKFFDDRAIKFEAI